MRIRPSPTPASEASALGTLLAALPPLLAMLAAATAFSRCLDADLLSAAVLDLEPADAPGSPLATLLGHAISWLPLGPLPLRIAFASSVVAAVAAAALYRAIEVSAGQPRRSAAAGAMTAAAPISAALALGFVLFAFGCEALFFAQPRAHVAGVALATLCLERLATSRASSPRRRARALCAAAFWLGLLAIEQPALALCVAVAALRLPGGGHSAQRAARARMVAAATALLLAIALMSLAARDPLRAHSVVASSVAHWAHAFQLAPSSTSFADRLSGLSASAWLLLGFASLCALRALRAPAAPRLLRFWLTLTLAALAGSLVLLHADALRALALCGAAASGALALGDLLDSDDPEQRHRLAFAIAILAVALGGVHLRATALRHMQKDAAHRDGRAIDVLREDLLRGLPARSTLLVDRDLARTLRDAELEERVRPDLLVAVKPWRLDLAESAALARSAPELQPAMRSYLLQGELPVNELRSLAARRPVLVEFSAGDEHALTPALLPFGLYHQVSTSTTTRNDARFAARDADARLAPLPALLEADPPDAGCRELLIDRALAAAAYYEQVKDAEHAIAARVWAASLVDKALDLGADEPP